MKIGQRFWRRVGALSPLIAGCLILVATLMGCDAAGGGLGGGTGGGGVTVPGVPTGFASTSTTSSSVTLGWTAVSGATSYRVYRSASQAGTYAQTGVDASSATFTDSGLSAATVYWYKVTAVNSAGEGAACSAVSATTAAAAGGAPVLWYGKGSIYLAVAGDNNDVKKYDTGDFDYNHNPTNAFLVNATTGEFWYQASASNAWYTVVAGSGNDVPLFAASDQDVASPSQYLVLNNHLCYVTVDGTGHPTVYQVVAGTSNDTILYAPADFDNRTACGSGNQLLSAGGKLLYIFFIGSNGYLWEMVPGASNDTQKYVIYPAGASCDMDCGAANWTVFGVFASVSGQIWHNESYTNQDLWQTVAGPSNDVQMFTRAADLDGQVVDYWSAGLPVFVKANAGTSPLLSIFPEVK